MVAEPLADPDVAVAEPDPEPETEAEADPESDAEPVADAESVVWPTDPNTSLRLSDVAAAEDDILSSSRKSQCYYLLDSCIRWRRFPSSFGVVRQQVERMTS